MGVRQGCILSPQLFNLLPEFCPPPRSSMRLTQYHDRRKLTNNLKFADDIILLAYMQTLVDKVHNASKNFGLKINIAKNQVQVINKITTKASITINSSPLEKVDQFTYLNGVIY